MWGIELAVMACMILLNAGLAAFEIALASTTVARLQLMVEARLRGSISALAMKKSMEGSLAVVQLGITLVGTLAAAIAGAGANQGIAPILQGYGFSQAMSQLISMAVVVIPLTMVTILFGELIPKVFAIRNPEKVLLRLAPIMKVFSYTVWPVVWMLENSVRGLMNFMERLTRSNSVGNADQESAEITDLRASAALARTSALIGKQQEHIILGAADISQRPVYEVMLDAEFINMLTVDTEPGDALALAHMDMHTRFPVTQEAGDPDKIIGYVLFKDIVTHLRFQNDGHGLQGIVRAISSFREDMPVAKVLESLIRDHAHIGLVRDATGTVTGMITLEDLMEELVGKIEDEYDRLPTQIVQTGQGWVVGGGVTLQGFYAHAGVDLIKSLYSLRDEDLNEVLEESLDDRYSNSASDSNGTPKLRPHQITINDWVAAHLQAPLKWAEVIEVPGVRMTVRKYRRNKVTEAFITCVSTKPQVNIQMSYQPLVVPETSGNQE